MAIARSIFLKMRNFSNRICRENKKKSYSIIFSGKLFRSGNNVENYSTARQVVYDCRLLQKRIACWIIKARYTHSEYVTHFYSTAKWILGAASVLYICTYIARLLETLCSSWVNVKLFHYRPGQAHRVPGG
jgi:hypothetical protein